VTTKVSYGVANIASQAEAEAGTAVDKFMTPERAAQALVAQAPATAQIVTFNGDSELTIIPNVVDGIYRISGSVYFSSSGSNIIVQTSDDNGVNYTDTTGDTSYFYMRRQNGSFLSAGAFSNAGHPIQVSTPSPGADWFTTFSAVLALGGADRVSFFSTSFDFGGIDGGVTLGGSTTNGNHDTGIDRIRFKVITGTVTGTVIVENLRLS
jgi:hypothetical protein